MIEFPTDAERSLWLKALEQTEALKTMSLGAPVGAHEAKIKTLRNRFYTPLVTPASELADKLRRAFITKSREVAIEALASLPQDPFFQKMITIHGFDLNGSPFVEKIWIPFDIKLHAFLVAVSDLSFELAKTLEVKDQAPKVVTTRNPDPFSSEIESLNEAGQFLYAISTHVRFKLAFVLGEIHPAMRNQFLWSMPWSLDGMQKATRDLRRVWVHAVEKSIPNRYGVTYGLRENHSLRRAFEAAGVSLTKSPWPRLIGLKGNDWFYVAVPPGAADSEQAFMVNGLTAFVSNELGRY